MPIGLRQLLQKYRSEAASEREKGTYFERLVKVWLENAPTQREQFLRVLTYADWARENRLDQRDTPPIRSICSAGSSLSAWKP
jgi:predicted helicase